MNIVVYLVNDNVAEFKFGFGSAMRLVELLPDASVSVCSDENSFVNELQNADVAVVWTFRQEWFALSPRLKVLATPAAGKDYFHVNPPDGVQLVYGTFHGAIMAETAAGMIIGMSRRLLQTAQLMTSQGKTWPRDAVSGKARRVRGSRVTILGFGHIGSEIGRILKPFGCRITGIRRSLAAAAPDWFGPEDRVISIADLDEALACTDHLVCVLPGGEQTTGLIGKKQISMLPDGAFIYNLGRGNAIDECALADGLSSGHIAGAALDVFAVEPLPDDSPLRTAPNTVLYPHSSAFSPDYMDLFAEELAGKLKKAAVG